MYLVPSFSCITLPHACRLADLVAINYSPQHKMEGFWHPSQYWLSGRNNSRDQAGSELNQASFATVIEASSFAFDPVDTHRGFPPGLSLLLALK